MSDTRDPQDVAESLDPEVLPDYDDPEGTLEYPPDRPMGVEEYGITPAQERVDEPLAERVAREVPESSGSRRGQRGVGRLAAPGDDDPTFDDDEAEAIADYTEDAADLSAEEDAVHVIDEP